MSLVFKVEHIDEKGLEFRESFSAGWLNNIEEISRGGDVELLEPIEVSGTIAKEGRNIRLSGRVRLKAGTVCSRCGEEAICSIDGGFELVLIPGVETSVEHEHEISREEFNQAYFSGPEIDVSDYFREQVALEWPMQVLCCPDCKGLCPGCGANLNRETCTCEKSSGDPRLAALRNLKVGKN